MEKEVHLFIAWPNALHAVKNILSDLSEHFLRLGVFNITWSDRYFENNMARFYGRRLTDVAGKIEHCGRGTFVVAVLLDEQPIYDYRWTSRGARWVNTRMFDAKQRYRKWVGGGHRIHATENVEETDHDIALLFGCTSGKFREQPTEYWKKPPIDLTHDLAGANGWRDLTELFNVLNATQPYVVLRNFNNLPQLLNLDQHGDIDLLVNNFSEAVLIAKGEPIYNQQNRVHMNIKVMGKSVPFDFRYVGDGYYDTLWQRDILARRLFLEQGVFVPSQSDHFYSLLYHAIVHKPVISPDYVEDLCNLTKALGRSDVTPDNFTNYRWMKGILNQFFRSEGYDYTKPVDHSVYVNHRVVGDKAEVIENRFQILLEATIMTPPLHTKKNIHFYTRVWRMSMPDGSSAALKLVKALTEESKAMLYREHEFLIRLDGEPFPTHLAHGTKNNSYFLVTRWIEGDELSSEKAKNIIKSGNEKAQNLANKFYDILERLKLSKINHRDIREKNFIIRDEQPILIDFGWSVFENETDVLCPVGLDEPDDRLAMESMLARLMDNKGRL